ncbi:MAG: SDR family NAD(P)-dependent oxidoreductase [Epsilonproteobacteria bacterium]|nr:SDR family NAD(P)-dependent oxidoreductase [Campylobacterota bacterium]
MFFLILSIILINLFNQTTVLPMEDSKDKYESAAYHKRAIVVGATSGMGRQVAKKLATEEGYEVGITGRRLNLLESLKQEIGEKAHIKQVDVTKPDEAKRAIRELIEELGGLDLFIVSVSAANDNVNETNNHEANLLRLNVDLLGFWHMADLAFEYFKTQGHGHLVGLSSMSGLVGEASSPVYSGCKAFIQRYLEGCYNYIQQNNLSNIYVTDIVPGWVEIEAEDVHKIPNAYWVETTQDAANEIIEAIKEKKQRAYITKRWEFIAFLYQVCPTWLYNKIGGF